jgi:hypothetical protein
VYQHPTPNTARDRRLIFAFPRNERGEDFLPVLVLPISSISEFPFFTPTYSHQVVCLSYLVTMVIMCIEFRLAFCAVTDGKTR